MNRSSIEAAIQAGMLTVVKYPPLTLQSMSYERTVQVSKCQRFQQLREQLGKEGFNLSLPTGNENSASRRAVKSSAG